MANNSVANGAIVGGLLGAAVLGLSNYVEWLGWFQNGVSWIASKLMDASWWPTWISSDIFVQYGIVVLAGLLVGIYVEKK